MLIWTWPSMETEQRAASSLWITHFQCKVCVKWQPSLSFMPPLPSAAPFSKGKKKIHCKDDSKMTAWRLQYQIIEGPKVTHTVENMPVEQLENSGPIAYHAGKREGTPIHSVTRKTVVTRPPFVWPSSLGVGFPGGSDGKESACNVGDPGSVPGSGRSPGGGHGNPL